VKIGGQPKFHLLTKLIICSRFECII